ncbi:nickel import ATP-binding protein NikE [Rhizobium sp. LCM 4573]|uniref:nickel import ATP-binding protein NikE n=1 Tax=Rhizobium sp. LCM 4573 TaxID=1848291 RepID=UPI0008D9EF18|nr:nickel import ATP-binding protein NikE [Rhizobium sp. LCM 4573]OHV82879.1 nickel import ATP-binding protein NikE [Rhizobium sp. LCM 4573]
MSLISAVDVSKTYQTHALLGRGIRKQVLENISLAIEEGETVALLGRSGCGKSTFARLLVGLEQPTSGEVHYRGRSIDELRHRETQGFRRDVQLVFQDSPGAVNGRFTVRAIICEPLRHLTTHDRAGREARMRELLEMVELPADIADMLPSQVSGGQLQRVCIARALAANPKLIILDEAVSNLDTHLQASALDLLRKLQRDSGMAYLFVTHDLRLARRFASRCLVMDEGRIVEEFPAASFEAMQHPASQLLKSAILPPMPAKTRRGAPVG